MKKLGMKMFGMFAIGMVIVLSFIIVTFNSSSASAEETQTLKYEEKVYCDATIDDEFDPTCVLIVIDKYTSEINKQYEEDFFGNFPKNAISDLTYITGDIEKNESIDRENFRQIIKIELSESSKENVINVIKQIEKIDGVLSAGPNYSWTLDSQPVASTGTMYSDLWGIHGTYGIQAEQAWDITTGSYDDVRVGIIDSGIANHPDLNANLVSGWDFINNNALTSDDLNGHGTHVAGIIGATGTNVNGVVGVNWNVQMVPMQAFDASGHSETDLIVSAITWAVSQNNIDILNFSAGGFPDSSELRTAINNFQGLFVCGAGNGYLGLLAKNNDEYPYYPSDYSQGQTFSDRVISVGAIKEDGNKRSSSNYGANSVSLFAPGEEIKSTVPTSIDASGYSIMNGTSMATAFVTGTAALLVALIESEPHNMTQAEISAAIKTAIMSSTTDNANLTSYCVAGGHLNAYEALMAISFKGQAFSDFGYNGSTYYWNGKVDMEIGQAYKCRLNASNIMVFDGNTDLDFSLSTVSHDNALSSINGTVSYQLRDSSNNIKQIEGNDTFVSTVNVNIWDTVTLGNTDFTINTLALNSNDTFTLTLTSTMTRGSWTDTDTKTLTFIVDIPPLCVAEGTLITLADGSQKPIEELTMEDQLLVWNHHIGDFDAAPMLFIESNGIDEYEIIHLYFSDGTEVKVIYEHGFWDATLNRYVFIRKGETTQYIGDWFNKQTTDENGNMIWVNVQLVDVQIYTEQTTTWSPITFAHLNYYVNGMLSMPGATEGLINIFEVDPYTLQYDQAAFQADIQTYGLFEYEDFEELIPEMVFDAFQGQYLTVSIGKGLITWEEIEALIAYYSEFWS